MATVRGGDRASKVIKELAERLARPVTLRVGFLENARYPSGTPVAMIAAIQNYGAPRANIPPRPFFSNMVAAKSPEWPEAISRLLQQNNYDIVKTLRLTGEAIKGQLQQSIRDTNSPPLRPATITRKGSAKPLIHTGHLLNSVAYSVKVG